MSSPGSSPEGDAAPAALVAAAQLIRRSRYLVAFTGAGISAESGIPTFRGPDGLWTLFDPEKVASMRAFREDPSDYWRFSVNHRPRTAEPNLAHHALVALEHRGHLRAVITQNTDGLHQRAGNRRVIELHGNSHRVRCLDCRAEYPRAEVDAMAHASIPPRCPHCDGSYLKPTVVFFGEALPPDAFAAAETEAAQADLMLVVGSSLQVHPADRIPRRGVEQGAELVILNLEPTPLDDWARCVLRGAAGELLPALVQML